MKTSLSEGEEKEKGVPGYEGDLAPGRRPAGEEPEWDGAFGLRAIDLCC